MNFKARFERKENTPDVSEADIVGVTELSREQYSRFYGQMLNDYDFIADYANETYRTEAFVWKKKWQCRIVPNSTPNHTSRR